MQYDSRLNEFDSDIAFHISTNCNSIKHLYQLWLTCCDKVSINQDYISNIKSFTVKDKTFSYGLNIKDQSYDLSDLYPNRKGYRFLLSFAPNQPDFKFEFLLIPRDYKFQNKSRGVSSNYKSLTKYARYNLICYWEGNNKDHWGFLYSYLKIIDLLYYLDNTLKTISISYKDKYNIFSNGINNLFYDLNINNEIKDLFNYDNLSMLNNNFKKNKLLLMIYLKLRHCLN